MSQPNLATSPTEDIYELRPGLRWLALAAALLAWGFDGVEQGVYSIMTRSALMDLLSTPSASGEVLRPTEGSIAKYFALSMAIWLWGAAAGGVIFGRIGDRFGRARGLIFSVTTYSVFTGLSAVSTSVPQFLACRFVGSMGLGGTWPLCVALLVETWPERHRAKLAGGIGSAANVGFLLAALYSGVMIHAGYNWRWIIGMGMLIALLSLPVIAFTPEPTKWRLSRQKKERSRLGDLFTPEFRRSTIVGSLLSTIALLGTWGSFLWLATHVDKLTAGTEFAGIGKASVMRWQSFGQIFGGFVGGLLAGWLGNKRSWSLLCLSAWASVFALFWLNDRYGLQMALMAALAGIFVTSFFGWLPKYLPELFPTRIRASGQGFAFNIGRILAGFGVLGAGHLVDLFDGDYAKGMMTMATVYLLGLLIIPLAPDTGGRMREDQAASTAEPMAATPAPVGEKV